MKFYTNVYRHKSEIFHSFIKDGKKHINAVQYEPHLAIPTREPTGWTTIGGQNVRKIFFDNIWEWQKFRKENEDIPLYNNIDPIYQFLVDTYPDEIKYNVKDIQIGMYDIECIDEEDDTQGVPDPEDVPAPIVSLAIRLSRSGKTYVFGLHDWSPDMLKPEVLEDIKKDGLNLDKVVYYKCENEEDLLKKVVRLFEKAKIDVLVGWYSNMFDNPYLINRIKLVLGDSWVSRLSPYGIKPTVEVKWFNGMKEFNCKIPGIALFDLMELYKKIKPLEGYALDLVARREKVGKKLSYSKYSNLTWFYKKDFVNFILYNIYDAELVQRIEDKLGIINTRLLVAYIHKCNFEDTLGQVKAWDQVIFDDLTKQFKVIPPMNPDAKKEKFVGAYVHEPIPGIYRWVVSFDVNSEYPSAVRQFNISPDTMIGYIDKVNRQYPDEKYLDPDFKYDGEYILAANGCAFRKDFEGFGARLMREMYEKRVACKNQLIEYQKLREKAKQSGNAADIKKYTALAAEYKAQDNARKVSLNSYFGALGNQYFRYFDVRAAEAITMTGQFAIVSVINRFNKEMKEKYGATGDTVVYCDTDSVFICLDTIIGHIFEETDDHNTKIDKIDRFAEEVLQPLINDEFELITKKMNCNETILAMKREKIMESALWKAKKHYACLVSDDEGARMDPPELMAKGIRLMQSSTPTAVKPFMEESVIQMMKDPKNLRDYIADVKDKFFAMTPDEIASPRAANNLKKYSDTEGLPGKGCPMGTRAALIHNACRARGDFEAFEIKEAEKIKFVRMKQPNPYFNSTVVGFNDEFRYKKEYVNYNEQFNKTFLEPIEDLAKEVGINISNQLSLEDLF